MFAGLTGLTTLWLDENPGADFTFTMTLKQVPDTDKVVVAVSQGAPFTMTTTIRVTGGILPSGVSSVTVPVGHTTSDEITVTPIGEGRDGHLGYSAIGADGPRLMVSGY